MNFLRSSFVAAVCLACMTASARAQGRTPTTGSAAIGGDIGVFLPADDRLDSGLTLEGFYEYYLTPRSSVRLGAGWMNPSYEREDEDSIRTARVAGDFVFNWEGGAVHPFVGAGVGIYFIQLKDNGESFGEQETEVGATLFGGLEFFNSRTVSIKAELRYHFVRDVGFADSDGAALTIGLKKYF